MSKVVSEKVRNANVLQRVAANCNGNVSKQIPDTVCEKY